MGCTNECRKWFSKEHCDYCQSNYVVSKERYVGKREANGAQVYGYLVKTKTGELHGILDSMSTEELTEYVNKLDRRWSSEILY